MTLEQPQSVDDALDSLLEARTPRRSIIARLLEYLHTRVPLLVGGSCITLLSVVLVLYLGFWRAPASFVAPTNFFVKNGVTLQATGERLYDAGLIRSVFWFKVWSKLLAGDKGIKAGGYTFDRPLGVRGLVSRLSGGAFGQVSVRVTIPEGTSSAQIADILKKKLPGFDSETFTRVAREKEGYLFPDTYDISATMPAEDIIAVMYRHFLAKIETVQTDIDAFGKPLEEIMVMASLLEEEARTTDTRRRIAGILWKRIEIGMPLQVDAVFPYIIGKNTFEITTEDLKVDSPYNTYKYAGLPPGPITNPGLDSILSAVTPIASNNLYYLSDKDGNMHYAISHADHVLNKAKYLR
ncbi:MAG: hypothetical protein COV91_01960 [Candidatus Taylorbacteria bacterium CG11_big_fil_rev_8_21_14_0_20_46_11]|uniref:Endolytic murein transglycosylase n=1 Tax=Candidatus Taylorbacteria bacterium CG11_big_fil_rev_8_21_14_0_20_46_11 TaxID=1975025 RepID=A0A2H0KC57_9BACT|nr:MAG: hypothetical protein COV91_01960 [Candidatus Taylorbacteria bacterium CG11_big_fil_rev_8_21_14_0_20_46_11]